MALFFFHSPSVLDIQWGRGGEREREVKEKALPSPGRFRKFDKLGCDGGGGKGAVD